jgi:hypothetical protein
MIVEPNALTLLKHKDFAELEQDACAILVYLSLTAVTFASCEARLELDVQREKFGHISGR